MTMRSRIGAAFFLLTGACLVLVALQSGDHLTQWIAGVGAAVQFCAAIAAVLRPHWLYKDD